MEQKDSQRFIKLLPHQNIWYGGVKSQGVSQHNFIFLQLKHFPFLKRAERIGQVNYGF